MLNMVILKDEKRLTGQVPAKRKIDLIAALGDNGGDSVTQVIGFAKPVSNVFGKGKSIIINLLPKGFRQKFQQGFTVTL